MKSTVFRTLVAAPLLVVLSLAAWAAPVQFTPAQQDAVNKLTAKGGLVMQLAADSDALVVNLSLAGKQATDAELAEVKNLPKVAQLNLANTAVTDAGLASVDPTAFHRGVLVGPDRARKCSRRSGEPLEHHPRWCDCTDLV